MKIAVYSAKDFEIPFLNDANAGKHELLLIADALSESTTNLCMGCTAVSIFAGDDASGPVLQQLAIIGVRQIAIRAAGYDNVDLITAKELGIKVANVPEYSPYAIAEHAVGMMLALDRKLVLADTQVKKYNFTVGNLVGFDLHDKTVGLIGTGKIGSIVAKILHGFGCRLFGYDLHRNELLEKGFGLKYTDLKTLCVESDIITIHTCLTADTRHLINAEMIAAMKQNVMIINTARGAIVDTTALIAGLESGKVGTAGLDVYEREKGVFFYNKSAQSLNDLQLDKLLNMPNVLITPHQAFATKEALSNIAATTIENIDCWEGGKVSPNELWD